MARDAFDMGGAAIAPGARGTVRLPLTGLFDGTPVDMPVHIVHGRRAGPTLFVSAAIHGDEVIGVEIARRLLASRKLRGLRGSLLVVPVVNAFGFLTQSRYLPDRRDLNRSFPGSAGGSLAARLAHLFMTEIVARSDVGIDLHSAAIHRTNLPQIRISPSKPETLALAQSFGAPVVITAKLREGSLRASAQKEGVDILLYEAGEALRFDEYSVRTGLAGILRVMQAMEMISARGVLKPRTKSLRASQTIWQRAPAGGLLRAYRGAGDVVEKGDLLGVISDALGEEESPIHSAGRGIIIGRTNLPVVNEGDALFHIALTRAADPESTVESLATQLDADPMFDEDEII